MFEINGNLFAEMLRGGAQFLAHERKLVDALNVFPVPDGDTGMNMSLTIQSAVRELDNVDTDCVADFANSFARGALRGARGNSGVILSQIFKGLSGTTVDKCVISTQDFASALTSGTEIAYAAVTKPKEGTILTVVRVMAETAYAITKRKNIEFEPFFEQVIAAGEDILAKTPDMLPVLKKANVVDAGGKGLISIFKGLQCILLGQPVPEGEADELSSAVDSKTLSDSVFTDQHDLDNIEYAYCTEFFITNLEKTTTEADIAKFKNKLLEIGNCVLVIGDVQFVKVHVHTNTPNIALGAALKLGELDGVKIENMLEQHRKLVGESKKEDIPHEKSENALISVCAGDGFRAIFSDFGVNKVVEGGQTMNPSVTDILNAINDVDANNVFIFPNNSNIILAANQAKELSDVNVIVVPTVNVPQGISAVLAFMPDATPDENLKTMTEAISNIKCGQVTHAVRNARMNGFSVKEGDIIGFSDKSLVAKGNDVSGVLLDTLAKFVNVEKDDAISLYYGEDVNEESALQLAEKVQEKYDDLEVMVYSGGQPHYYYVFSVE